ncbi:hypothetical protein MTO96_032574 [Rhipicephalus appendiculatus]
MIRRLEAAFLGREDDHIGTERATTERRQDQRAKREMELRRLLHQVRCWLRVMFVLANNLYCIPTYLAWIWSAEYYVDEVGEDVSECYSDRTLVLVNHQSTADVPLLMASFQGKRSVTEHLMWIMDRLFKYTNFGAVSMTHGDFFITQGKDTRNTQLQRLRDHIAEVYLRRGLKWIVLFPEGGFLHKRRATSQRYARANGYPILEHVTLPRVGAMKTVLETLSSENLEKTHKGEEAIKWVVDITIGYPDMGKPLDLFVISGGFRKQCVVHMHYRRFPISEVPIHDSEALTKWLYDRGGGEGAGKNHPAPLRETPLRVDFNIVWIVLVHAFFIMSTLFHVALFRWLASLVPFW